MVLSALTTTAHVFLALFTLPFRTHPAMQLEILARRHQLAVHQRVGTKPRLKPADRIFWAWLSRVWSGWPEALVFVQPATVIAWQRKRFSEHWTRLRRGRRPGRPVIPLEVRALIRRMSWAHSGRGAPRRVVPGCREGRPALPAR